MSDTDSLKPSPMDVPLADAVAGLRDELTRAWMEGQHQRVRFRPACVELTLQVAATRAAAGSAKVRWWVVEVGGDVSRQATAMHTVRVVLEPGVVDESTGQIGELAIEGTAGGVGEDGGSGEIRLEGSG